MLALFILVGTTHVCTAQSVTMGCAASEANAGRDGSFGVAEAPLIPVTGPFRALVVYVQYLDDTGTNQPGCGPEDWPLGSFANPTMPVIGARILEPSVGTPSDPESLTSFYWEQSRGNFVLYGDEIGYVTQQNESAYLSQNGRWIEHGRLSREILTYLASPAGQIRTGINLANYDANRDGQLDHLFVVLRRRLGASGLYGGLYYGGVSELDYCSSSTTFPLYAGLRVSCRASGSFNLFQPIDPMRENVAVLAHEIGHDIWAANVHLPPVSSNGIPALPPLNTTGFPGDIFTGYGLMVSGTSEGRAAVGVTNASAAERAQVSRRITDPSQRWIACTMLADGQAVTVRDVATVGDCYLLPVRSGTDIREVYLSNVQRASPFNTIQLVQTGIDDACPGCRTIERSMMPTTGLMVEAVSRPSDPTVRWTRDIVPADNRLSGFQGCDIDVNVGPRMEQVFAGDLWRPGLDRQLTPWTRPSVYGYNTLGNIPAAERGAILSNGLHAIDDIRQGAGTNIDFTYHRFYTGQPVVYVREDWWITPETNGLATFAELRVQSGATLHVENNALLTVLGRLVIEEGGALETQDGDIHFGPGGGLVVEKGGVMTANATVFSAQNPSQGWAGIRFAAGPQVTWTNVTVQDVVTTSPDVETTSKSFDTPAAVTLYDRELVVSGGIVTGTRMRSGGWTKTVSGGGFYVSGARGTLVLRSNAQVEDNVGAGVRVGAGGSAGAYEGSLISANGGPGVVVEGTNAYALLSDITVQLNRGVGVVASMGGRVAFNPLAPTGTIIDRNAGGLSASGGSDISAGVCGRRRGCDHTVHDLPENGALANGTRDAQSLSGSVVYAQGNRWGQATSAADLILFADANSFLSVEPLISTASWRGAAGSPVLATRGIAAAPLFALASQHLADGDTLAAVAAVTGALDAAADDDDRRAGYEAAARLAALVQPLALISRLSAEAQAAGAVRVWAQRALLAAYETGNRTVEAEGLAQALVAGHIGTEHEAAGWAALVRLAVRAGDEPAAVTAYGALNAGFPDDEATLGSGALIASAFMTEGAGSAGRGAASPAKAGRATTSNERALGTAEIGLVVPNPVAGRAVLDVAMPEAGQVTVETFDALGRRVGLASEAAVSPGRSRTALDVSALPPGLYVARVTVRMSGQTLTASRRFVVAR